jgi:F0F1-type ATP synthase membrane subunit b/b'
MKIAVLVLYMVAFVFQLLGAAGVIQDVRQSLRNARKLRDDLADAERVADEHRNAIQQGPAIVAELGRRLGNQAEQIIRQLGPASLRERQALVAYNTAQNDVSDLRRWGAVALLVLGVVLGFAGNVLSLYIPNH